MKRVLVPYDGSKPAQRALKHVIGWVEEGAPIEVDLFNVQIPMATPNVRRFIAKSTIDSYQREAGEEVLKSGRAMLDKAGMQYTSETAVGHLGETIVQRANKMKADGIVMGTRGMGTVKNLVMGSVATQVVHLADVPVTLVK